MHFSVFPRPQEFPKESIPQFARGRFYPAVFLGGLLRHVAARTIKLQPMLTSQARDKLLILVRFCPSKLVVEMNNGNDDAKLTAQFEEQAKKRNRINPARNRDSNPIPGPQQFLAPDIFKHALRQLMHRNMVRPRRVLG